MKQLGPKCPRNRFMTKFVVNFWGKWAVFLTSTEKLKIQLHPGDLVTHTVDQDICAISGKPDPR